MRDFCRIFTVYGIGSWRIWGIIREKYGEKTQIVETTVKAPHCCGFIPMLGKFKGKIMCKFWEKSGQLQIHDFSALFFQEYGEVAKKLVIACIENH